MALPLRAVLLIAILPLLACRAEPPLLDPVQRTVYSVRPAVVRVRAYATARFVARAEAVGAVHDSIVRRGFADPADWPARPLEVDTGAGGSGSGFAVHPDGIILTSGHVVSLVREPAAVQKELIRNGATAALLSRYSVATLRSLERTGALQPLIDTLTHDGSLREIRTWREIELSNGQSVPFSILDFSPSLGQKGDDVAILRIAAHDLPTIPLGDSSSVRIQDRVLAFGFPSVASSTDEVIGGWLSHETDLEATVNRGSITAIRKNVADVAVFQTDIPLYPGTSGGPLTDIQGNAIGLVTWGHATAETIRFIVPIEVAASRIAALGIRLEETGSFTPRYRSAIDAIQAGRWRAAERHLQRADEAFPGNPDVARLRRDITSALRQGRWWNDPAVTISFSVLAGGVILLLFLSLHRRSRPLAVVHPARPAARPAPATLPGVPANGLMGKLTFLNGPLAGQRIGLGGSGILLGRERGECEIVIPDPRISRVHAELVRDEGRVLLVDRDSSNGTWVNGERVARHELGDGDIINLGGRNAIAVAFHR